MQVRLSEISLHNIGGKMMGQCPQCRADHPSLEVTRDNGSLRGFCSICGLTIAEVVKELSKEAPQKRATTLGEVIVDVDQFRGLDLPEKKRIITPWLSEQTITPSASGCCKRWPWRLIHPLCRAGTPNTRA